MINIAFHVQVQPPLLKSSSPGLLKLAHQSSLETELQQMAVKQLKSETDGFLILGPEVCVSNLLQVVVLLPVWGPRFPLQLLAALSWQLLYP